MRDIYQEHAFDLIRKHGFNQALQIASEELDKSSMGTASHMFAVQVYNRVYSASTADVRAIYRGVL